MGPPPSSLEGTRRRLVAEWPYSTAAWRRLRTAKLAASPICEVCVRRDRIELANTVDHVVSIASGGDAFPPLEGLMSMCASCHAVKTNAVDNPQAAGGQPPIVFKGADVSGLPIDPGHPFWGGGGPRTGD